MWKSKILLLHGPTPSPDPSEIRAFDFKREFRRSAIWPVSASIDINRSIFSDGRRSRPTNGSQKKTVRRRSTTEVCRETDIGPIGRLAPCRGPLSGTSPAHRQLESTDSSAPPQAFRPSRPSPGMESSTQLGPSMAEPARSHGGPCTFAKIAKSFFTGSSERSMPSPVSIPTRRLHA